MLRVRRPLAFWLGAAAVVVAAVLRLWVWETWSLEQVMQNDSYRYWLLAETFPRVYLTDDPYTLLRTPGYPAFLSFFSTIKAAAFGNVLLGVATVSLIWRWGAERSELVGAVAAWLVAIEPASIVFGGHLLAESLFVFLIVAGLWAVTRRHVGWLLAGGTLLAMAALVKPIGVYLPLLVAGVIWWQSKRWQSAVAVLAVPVLLLGGWAGRNAAVFDVPAVSSIDSASLLYWKASGVIAAQTGRDYHEVRQELQERWDQREWRSVGDRWRAEREAGLSIITSDPGSYVAASAKPTMQMFSGVRSGEIAETFGVNLVPFAPMFLVVYAAAALGALRDRDGLLFGVAVAYFVLLSIAPETYERFRVPWWPFVAMLAAASLGDASHSESVPDVGVKIESGA